MPVAHAYATRVYRGVDLDSAKRNILDANGALLQGVCWLLACSRRMSPFLEDKPPKSPASVGYDIPRLTCRCLLHSNGATGLSTGSASGIFLLISVFSWPCFAHPPACGLLVENCDWEPVSLLHIPSFPCTEQDHRPPVAHPPPLEAWNSQLPGGGGL